MKKLVVLFLIAAFAFSAKSQIEPNKSDMKPDQIDKMLVIKGNVPWKSAGITLKVTDKVTITASGEVLFNASEPNSAVSPTGLGQLSYKKIWTGDAEHCDDPFGKINHAALIAKVGNNGLAFFVGDEKDITGKQGELFFGINDCTFVGPYENSGQFNVNIHILRFGKSMK